MTCAFGGGGAVDVEGGGGLIPGIGFMVFIEFDFKVYLHELIITAGMDYRKFLTM
jgi:hypothetical protein